MYHQPPSFTNLLPWVDYDPETQLFLLADGRGYGALFELRAAGCEARPEAWLIELRDKLQGVLCSLPEADPPWIVQLFVQDEPLPGLVAKLAAYGRDEARDTEFAARWREVFADHFRDIARPEGLFADRVGGGRWRGRLRRVRATLSRPFKHPYPGPASPAQEMSDVADRFAAGLDAAGIGVRRGGGGDLYEWMFRWLNPAPPHWGPDGTEDLLAVRPYPGGRGQRGGEDGDVFGFDLGNVLLNGLPVAEPGRGGVWFFDGVAHRALAVQRLERPPALGVLTLERRMGDHVFAVLDRMP
ncbi:TraC family protein, partial [Methylomagnum sp.]